MRRTIHRRFRRSCRNKTGINTWSKTDHRSLRETERERERERVSLVLFRSLNPSFYLISIAETSSVTRHTTRSREDRSRDKLINSLFQMKRKKRLEDGGESVFHANTKSVFHFNRGADELNLER